MIQKIKKYLKKKFTRVIKEKVIVPVMYGELLEDRWALITGGSSGIGFSIANSFLKNGASVIITGRNIEKLNLAKKELIEKNNIEENRVIIYQMDLSDIVNIKETLKKILVDINNDIDILVNNAGINVGEFFPNTTVDDFDTTIEVNLRGLYFLSQEFVKYMIDKNIKGNILNISSSSALRPAISPYIISKWGEKSLTLGMAKKCMKYGITVNSLAPSSTLTPMLKKENNDENDLYLEYAPLKRYLAPEEVGNMATILVSKIGKMVIGDTIYMTGGAGILTFDDMNY